MSMFRVVSLPFCQVVMLDEWDAPPSRYFAAYAARGSSRCILGHPVVDEFATLSSPVFLTPRPLLGKIYNAGISLGHLRDAEMALDLGWPPLCLGLDLPVPGLPTAWETQMLEAIKNPSEDEPETGVLTAVRSPSHQVESYRLADIAVMALSEPLLPRQLLRLCEALKSPVSVVIALGNRIGRSKGGEPQVVRAVSEARLTEIVKTVESFN